MYATTRRWKVAVEPDDERDTGRTGKPRTNPSDIADDVESGCCRNDPEQASEVTGTRCHSLKESRYDVYATAGDEPQERSCARDIQKRYEGRGNVDRAWQGAPRILHLISHHCAQLEARIREGNRCPEIQLGHVAEIGSDGAEIDRGSGYSSQSGMQSEANEHSAGRVGANGSGVLQPAASLEADHVHQHRQPECAQRSRKDVRPVVHQRRVAPPDGVGGDHCRRHEEIGIVENVFDPVAPAAQKAVPLTEGRLGPEVDTSLLR